MRFRRRAAALATGVGLLLTLLPNAGVKAAPGDINLRYSECGGMVLGMTGDQFPGSIVVGPDGKTVVTGTRTGGGVAQQFFVARLTSQGALDESFADGGAIVDDLGGRVNTGGQAIVQPDGKIVMLGAHDASSVVVRFNSDGSVDSGFANNGVYVLPGVRKAMARQSSGKIVVLTNAGTVRLTTAGTLDDSLGADAKAQSGDGMTLDSAGRILTTFTNIGAVGVVRFTSEGATDTTFGTSGMATRPRSNPWNVQPVALSDDSVVLDFRNLSDSSQSLVKFTSTGVADDTFGSSGAVDIAKQMWGVPKVDSSDRLLLGGGTSTSTTDAWIARFSSTGVADVSFGVNGMSTPGVDGQLTNVAVLPSGDPVAVGEFSDGTNQSVYILGFQSQTSTAPQGLVVDGWGGVHSFTTCGGDRPTVSDGPYWPGWSIVRGIAATSSAGGVILDGWGGLHPVTVNGNRPTSVNDGPYWQGWDITRGVAMLPDGTGGYILDGWGGLHPFGLNGHAAPAATTGGAYWAGWDIARGVTILPDGSGGYVVDGFGGLHPFSITGAMPPSTADGPYWYGWDIVRGVAVSPGGTGGYVVDGYGGPHTFAIGPNWSPEQPLDGPYWSGWDIARGITVF